MCDPGAPLFHYCTATPLQQFGTLFDFTFELL